MLPLLPGRLPPSAAKSPLATSPVVTSPLRLRMVPPMPSGSTLWTAGPCLDLRWTPVAPGVISSARLGSVGVPSLVLWLLFAPSQWCSPFSGVSSRTHPAPHGSGLGPHHYSRSWLAFSTCVGQVPERLIPLILLPRPSNLDLERPLRPPQRSWSICRPNLSLSLREHLTRLRLEGSPRGWVFSPEISPSHTPLLPLHLCRGPPSSGWTPAIMGSFKDFRRLGSTLHYLRNYSMGRTLQAGGWLLTLLFISITGHTGLSMCLA